MVQEAEAPHDQTFQAWLKENRTIACPTCGQGLQKQEGCNHLQYAPGFLILACALQVTVVVSHDLHGYLAALAVPCPAVPTL